VVVRRQAGPEKGNGGRLVPPSKGPRLHKAVFTGAVGSHREGGSGIRKDHRPVVNRGRRGRPRPIGVCHATMTHNVARRRLTPAARYA
jgi:hypothetical protein